MGSVGDALPKKKRKGRGGEKSLNNGKLGKTASRDHLDGEGKKRKNSIAGLNNRDSEGRERHAPGASLPIGIEKNR